MDQFSQAFENNFYLTQEFADFCAQVSHLPLGRISIDDQNFFILKNKNISISNYSEHVREKFRSHKISHSTVQSEVNNRSSKPSALEYSIFHKISYEQAAKNYSTSFFHGLRESRKFPHTVRIERQPNRELIEKIYRIYTLQMRRRNSFILPLSFFEAFLSKPSAQLFLIESNSQIIAYFCCFQYRDNIYSSIGGGDPRYFSHKSSNKLYDELIKYACANNLNIHMGIGEYASGYQKFKQNAGAVNYRLEQFPNREFLLKISFFLVRFRITGKILQLLSKCFPQLVAYEIMPFT
jgi:hypothetical protein